MLPMVNPYAKIFPIYVDNSLAVMDIDGRVMYDLFNDAGILSLGYYPKMRMPLTRPNFMPLMYTSSTREKDYEQLSEILGFPYIWMSGSGSESVEVMIKIMRKHMVDNGRDDKFIYAYRDGFHGRTLGSLSVTDTHNRIGFEPLLPWVKFFSLPSEIKDDCGGILLATVFTHHKIMPYTDSFWDGINVARNKYDVLLGLDEIKVGAGRWGTNIFAHESWDIKPDMCALAKGISAGKGVALTCINERAGQVMKVGDHFSTYSGREKDLHWTLNVIKEIKRHLPTVKARNEAVKNIAQKYKFIPMGEGNLVGIMCDSKIMQAQLDDAGIILPVLQKDWIIMAWNFNITDVEFDLICLGLGRAFSAYRKIYPC